MSAEETIRKAWDKIGPETLPHDWTFINVPVIGDLTPTNAPRPRDFPFAVANVPRVTFIRTMSRPFANLDAGRTWSIVFGRFDGHEVLVEAVKT